jgi:hypothetical protein
MISTRRRQQAADSNASTSGSTSSNDTGGGVFAGLATIGLGWWGIASLLHHAHQHHQSVLAFVSHAIMQWLT